MNTANRDIFINIFSSIVSLLTTTLIMLFVYREANKQLGFELIGLWSILTAISSLGSIGAFGFAGSLIKYSAELQAKKQLSLLPGLINTSFLILSAGLFFVLSLMYVLAVLFLNLIVDEKYLEQAFSLLPFSFLIFFITIMGQTILSVIEGLNKNWQKNAVLLTGQFVFMILSLLWLPVSGLKGLLQAQLIQAILVFCSAMLMLRINLPGYLPYSFSRDRGMVGDVVKYGIKFQSQTILNLLFEPVTKIFFSRYGGLSYVGLFELGSRIVVQVRSILLAIVTNLLPKLIHLHVTETQDSLNKSFKQIFRLNFDLFAITFGGFSLLSVFILKLWLGSITPQLLFFTYILTLGWWVNSLSLIPYMFNLGSGKLGINVKAHGITSGLNLVLGGIIILLNLEAICFLYAFVISISLGSIFILTAYARLNRFNLRTLITIRQVVELAAIVLISIAARAFLLSGFVSEGFGYIVLSVVYFILALLYLRLSGTYFIILDYFRTFIGGKLMSRDR